MRTRLRCGRLCTERAASFAASRRKSPAPISSSRFSPNTSTIPWPNSAVYRSRVVVGSSGSAKILFTSCRDGAGIGELSDAIRDSLGAVRKERWARSAKERSTKFLEERRVTCRDRVAIAAGLAVANGLNPVPGIDVAADIGILLKLFADVRTTYGLDDAEVASMSRVPPALAAGLKDIALLATKGGLARLIEKYASHASRRALLKWTPFIGQIVAASTGFAMMSSAGNEFVKECHSVASAILETELASY